MRCAFHVKFKKKSSFLVPKQHAYVHTHTHSISYIRVHDPDPGHTTWRRASLCPNARRHWLTIYINLYISLHDRLVWLIHDILLADFYLHLLLKHYKHYLLPTPNTLQTTKSFKQQTEDFSLDKWGQCSQTPSGRGPGPSQLSYFAIWIVN